MFGAEQSAGAENSSESVFESGDSTASHHKGMMLNDRCRGGRRGGKTSDKLEQDHSSFEGG